MTCLELKTKHSRKMIQHCVFFILDLFLPQMISIYWKNFGIYYALTTFDIILLTASGLNGPMYIEHT